MNEFVGKGFPLDPDYVDCGTVTKLPIYDKNGVEVSLLELSPGAKIKKHVHPEAETFTNVSTGEIKSYAPGEPHGLENPYGFSQKWVSMKTTHG